MKRADLEVARIEAEINARQERADTADMLTMIVQVLRNRERSWADEVLIAIFAGIFILPFIDALQATWTGQAARPRRRRRRWMEPPTDTTARPGGSSSRWSAS